MAVLAVGILLARWSKMRQATASWVGLLLDMPEEMVQPGISRSTMGTVCTGSRNEESVRSGRSVLINMNCRWPLNDATERHSVKIGWARYDLVSWRQVITLRRRMFEQCLQNHIAGFLRGRRHGMLVADVDHQ